MNKFKLVKFENIFKLVCVSLFFYQFVFLFTEYNKGKTVVHIEISSLFDEGPPGITICPAGVNMHKMATVNHKYKKLYQDYLSIINDSEDLLSKFNYQYHYILYKDINDGILSLDDIFNKYMYDYQEEINNGNFKIVLQKMYNVDSTIYNDDGYLSTNLVKPIESYSSDGHLIFKCFTYFSELNVSWKNELTNFQYFYFFLKIDKFKYFNHYDAIRIALHSSNDMPSISLTSSYTLTKNYFWISRFTTYKVERLGHQYDTNCLEYNKGGTFITRQGCIRNCYITKLKHICNGTALSSMGFLEQTWSNTTKYVYCRIQNKIRLSIYPKCQSSCKLNCQIRYYSPNFIRENALNLTRIFISKNFAMPDITIKHIPEISFISFVCNFGGLLGMWLGLSFIQILTSIKQIVEKLLKPKATINN